VILKVSYRVSLAGNGSKLQGEIQTIPIEKSIVDEYKQNERQPGEEGIFLWI
jgi:hypothetical protein